MRESNVSVFSSVMLCGWLCPLPRHLVKTQQTENLVCDAVNCGVCELAIALYFLVVMICKCSINPITNPHPVYNHSIACKLCGIGFSSSTGLD
jgi:hypothetical protein